VSQLSFSLDIPSEATPAFSLTAGEGGFSGGLEWRVKLSFLVSSPRKRNRASIDGRSSARNGAVEAGGETARNMVPIGGEVDNRLYTATQGLEPIYGHATEAKGGRNGGHGLEGQRGHAGRTEVVDCEIPIKVLAGNTAFLVKPSVHVI
jgi:hypothetical protein